MESGVGPSGWLYVGVIPASTECGLNPAHFLERVIALSGEGFGELQMWLVPEETSGIWLLEAKATWLPSDGEVRGSVPCVHLLWALHRVPHTVRPVEWTSHRLWDPHIQSCGRTNRLSTHHFAFASEWPRVGRGPVQAVSPWSRVDSHLTCILSHSSALQLHPLFFFSQRQKNILHWKSHLSLQSVQGQNISGGVGEMMSKWESSRRWGTAFHPKAGISTWIARKNQRPNPQLSKEFMTLVLKNHQLEVCRKEGKNEQNQSDMCKKYAI